MINRVTHLLIGKDIARSAGVTAGEDFVDFADGADALASGEIVVLDSNLVVLAAGATIADTDTIYIAQGTANTYDAGTLTGVREIVLSAPIEGAKVKRFTGEAYAAKSEQVTTLDFTGLTPVVGTEYIIRIIYKDITEHPGQFTHTYRYKSTTAVLADFIDALDAKIAAHSGRRVNATNTATTLILTGRAITECTSSLSNIDPFTMVEFDAFSVYVATTGWTELEGSTGHSTVAASKGSGTWEQMRDLEKATLSHRGPSNPTHFPIIKPDMATVKDETYDLIVIEHDKGYRSPDNAYAKDASLTTVIALADGASQVTQVLAALNPWMASTPAALPGISF